MATLPPSTTLDVLLSLVSGRADSPAGGAVAVTASDATADPSGPFRALWVGGAGTVKLNTLENNDVSFVGVPAGTILPVGCTRVWSTGTTATSIVGLR